MRCWSGFCLELLNVLFEAIAAIFIFLACTTCI